MQSMRALKILITLLAVLCCLPVLRSQELGLNFNHNPENIDFTYVRKIHPDWIRTTPRILDYVDGQLHVAASPAIDNIIKAGKAGYKIAFGFRWDFKKRNLPMPAPGAAAEKRYFIMVDSILEKVGPFIQIFTLGNEPNLETMAGDLQYNSQHQVPLILFTQSLLRHVLSFYQQHPTWKLPKIYAGSLPALFEMQQQKTPGVYELIRLAENTKAITGLAIHLHIEDTLEIAKAFTFVRSIMAEKPIIVPEFSLFRLYNKHFKDSIGSGPKGAAFLQANKLPAGLKIYQWLTLLNKGKVPYRQFIRFFASQPWYVPHYLKTFYRYYQRYGVVLATYPLLQQGYAKKVTPHTPSWFLNPLFLQKSFGKNKAGAFDANPLVYKDYMDLLNRGRQASNMK